VIKPTGHHSVVEPGTNTGDTAPCRTPAAIQASEGYKQRGGVLDYPARTRRNPKASMRFQAVGCDPSPEVGVTTLGKDWMGYGDPMAMFVGPKAADPEEESLGRSAGSHQRPDMTQNM
jgi:hypothetical protein